MVTIEDCFDQRQYVALIVKAYVVDVRSMRMLASDVTPRIHRKWVCAKKLQEPTAPLCHAVGRAWPKAGRRSASVR